MSDPQAGAGALAPSIRSLGLVAGEGDFPLLVARAGRGAGVRVHGFGIRGFASPALEAECDAFTWVDLGKVGATLKAIENASTSHVILAGRVPHAAIFKTGGFDGLAMKLLAKAVTRRADTLLGLVVEEFAKANIEVLDSSLFLKSLMPAEGMLTSRRPLSEDEKGDLAFGYPLAKAIAGHDIGQTIVVKDRMVVAVEGLEGTDKCIRRAGELAGPGCVAIKVSKPRQDLRFDIPVIGNGTMDSLTAAGCTALAVSAGESLFFDREEVTRRAEEAGIAMVALTDESATRLATLANS